MHRPPSGKSHALEGISTLLFHNMYLQENLVFAPSYYSTMFPAAKIKQRIQELIHRLCLCSCAENTFLKIDTCVSVLKINQINHKKLCFTFLASVG